MGIEFSFVKYQELANMQSAKKQKPPDRDGFAIIDFKIILVFWEGKPLPTYSGRCHLHWFLSC